MVGPYSSHYTTSYDNYYYSSTSVDCTLSLGTPSIRRSPDSDDQHRHGSGADGYSGWDFHHQSEQRSSKASAGAHKSRSHRGESSGGDTLLARRCANCNTTSTPLWRNGPRGPKSLCNACGIRYKKEERRAAAASTTNVVVGGVSEEMEDNHTAATGYYDGASSSSWSHQYFSPAASMGNEYGFIGDMDGRDSDPGIQFATWHFNVTGQAYQPESGSSNP